MNCYRITTILSFLIPRGLPRHLLPAGVLILVILTLGVGCAPKPANTLQGAVSTVAMHERDAPDPGRIVEQEIRGDWAYVITESNFHVGHGEFVIVKTSQGHEWTVLSFVIFEVRGKTLRLVWFKIGGNLAKAKKETLDKSIRETAQGKWQSYLTNQGYTID